MRILLGFVFLTGCCLFQSRNPLSAEPEVTTTSKIADPEPEATELDSSSATVFGFDEASLQTPDPIPADVFPELDLYSIDTRVVIEGQPIQMLHNGKMVEGIWWARKSEDVQRDFANAERIYEQTGIKFHISEVSFREINPNIIEHFIEANMHSDQMTVVYMLPNGFTWDGYSSGPWESVNRGMLVHYLGDEWTLAHEIGHYFGLLHPFNKDYVDDTPEQTTKYCARHFSLNCGNIMNYCDHKPKYATSGQVERFKRFMRAKRMDHYVREYTDVMLRGHKFPTPSGTNITFNLKSTEIDVNSP